MDVDEVMKFLGREVWMFLFNKQITKLQTNRKGINRLFRYIPYRLRRD